MKAALYARVSTEEQAQNFSIDNQLDHLRNYCRQHGLTIASEYVDPGFSGTTLDRPALTELLRNARFGAFDIILVYKLDRLFRSNRHMYNTLAEWEELGVSFASITESFDTSTAMGKAMLGMLSTFAEWERNTLMERSRDGTRKAVERGIYPGGIVAYGYCLSPETKQLEIAKDEAYVVRQVFEMLIQERMSCPSIAKRLNALGIPTRYAKDGRGIRGRATAQKWHPGRVYNMLRNSAYKGEWQYGKRTKKQRKELIAVRCPAIIDEATFEAAQIRLKENNLWADRNSRRNYLLRGLMKCGLCGHSYVGCYSRSTSKGELRYYKCDGKGNRGQLLTNGCVAPTVPADAVEELVWQEICDFIESPEIVTEALRAKFNSRIVDWDGEIATVERRIRELNEVERRLLRLYTDPRANFSEEALRAEVLEVTSARDTALSMKQKLEEARTADDWQKRKLEDAEAILVKLKGGIENATAETKREIIETLLQGIKVGKSEDGYPSLKIVYAFSRDNSIWSCYNSKCDGLPCATMPVRLLWRPGEGVHLLANPDLTLSAAH